VIPLTAKTFDLLLILVQGCRRTDTKSELLEALRPEATVENRSEVRLWADLGLACRHREPFATTRQIVQLLDCRDPAVCHYAGSELRRSLTANVRGAAPESTVAAMPSPRAGPD
jgi:hypothetical protein